MPRPRKRRLIRRIPEVEFFKPQGVPLRSMDYVRLTLEETETLRLRHLENLDQTKSASAMKTSQSTFQRILKSAHQKITDAIINGKALMIEKPHKLDENPQ